VLIPSLMSFVHGMCLRGSCLCFVTGLFFYGEGLLLSRPTPKLEDNPLPFVHGCLFNVFQVEGSCLCFVTSLFFMVRGCTPTSNPKAGGQPLVVYPRLLIQCIQSLRLMFMFRNRFIFLWWGVVTLTPNNKAGGQPLVVCPRLIIQCISSRRLMFMFRNNFIFYCKGLLLSRPTPKLEDNPLSFVHGCLFNVFQVGGSSVCFVTGLFFIVRGCYSHAQPPSWRTTTCRLSTAAYSMYSKTEVHVYVS
jgi:hypothetical protein